MPANHVAMSALCATQSDSPPKPKTVRPIHMTYHADVPDIDAPSAKTACPPVMKSRKTMSISRVPSLSHRYPPKKGRITFGHE